MQVPGIGPLIATAFVAAVGSGHGFVRGRDLAAWLGLVPRQHSTGGKPKLLGISKRGNPYPRRVFLDGARTVQLHTHRDRHLFGEWLNRLQQRVYRNVVVTTLANRLALIAWVVLFKKKDYRLKTRNAMSAAT